MKSSHDWKKLAVALADATANYIENPCVLTDKTQQMALAAVLAAMAREAIAEIYPTINKESK